MVSNAVENQVVALRTFGEILLGVIDDPICADGSDHVHISRAANAGHICAERLGDLDGERAHASRRAIDQDLLPGLDLSLVAKTLQCGECRDGYGGRLLKCDVAWFDDQCDSEAHTYSAKAPWQVPNTSSPGLNWVTFLPTASTWPATSTPNRVILWFAQPGHLCE